MAESFWTKSIPEMEFRGQYIYFRKTHQTCYDYVMARIARVIAVGYPNHITQRGNRRQKTFFYDEDYTAYIELMAHWCQKYNVEIWAWCPTMSTSLPYQITKRGWGERLVKHIDVILDELIFGKIGGVICGKKDLHLFPWMSNSS